MKDIRGIKIDLINSGIDSHELKSLTVLLSAEPYPWEEACMEKTAVSKLQAELDFSEIDKERDGLLRKARVDGERNRRARDEVDLTKTDDMTAETGDLIEDNEDDSCKRVGAGDAITL